MHTRPGMLLLVLALASPAAWADIPWRGVEALETSADPRPRFVYFHAEWCSWCRAFERDTLQDPAVAKRIAARFLPVRLDADRHRSRFLRLGGRGLPFVAVLTPEGASIADFTGVLPPDALLEWLRMARQAAAPPPAIPVDPERFHDALEALFDPRSLRFAGRTLDGIEAGKRPQPLVLRHLLESCFGNQSPCGCPDPRWRQRLPAMLDRLRERLEDPQEGGFFFYVDPDSGHVEPAKRLGLNARMLWLYASACRGLRRDQDCAAARRTFDWIEDALHDPRRGAYLAGTYRSEGRWLIDGRRPTLANAQLLVALAAAQGLSGIAAESRIPELLAWLKRRQLPSGGFTADDENETAAGLDTEAWAAQAFSSACGMRCLPSLRALFAHIAREHAMPPADGLSETPHGAASPFAHPAGNGRLARLLLRLPDAARPDWAPALLPGMLETQRWRPGIELDDLVPGVEAACLVERRRPAGDH